MADVTTGSMLRDIGTENGTKPRFYDSSKISYQTAADFAATLPEAERAAYLEQYGNSGAVGTILNSPSLVVIRYKAKPGESVPPHRHGVNQITFVLSGELRYGSQKTTAGMGYFSPNRKYSWVAGPEGADFLEIFDGVPELPIYD